MSERNAKLLRKYEKAFPEIGKRAINALKYTFRNGNAAEKTELRNAIKALFAKELTKIAARRERASK